VEPSSKGKGLVVVRAAEAQSSGSGYLQGVTRQILASNIHLLLAKHLMPAGSHVERHEHPHDQLVYIVSGRLRWSVGEHDAFEIAAGDSLIVSGGIPHECWALEETVSLDIFDPCRADFLAGHPAH